MQYKTLRTTVLWITGIAALLVLLLLLAQRYLGPEVKRVFITELNKSLTAEVQIDDVNLSLFKDFPLASVRFSGVRIKEATKIPSKNYLLTAGSVSLRFNIWDLLNKKYHVRTIRLDDIEVAPHIYSDGSDNFHFWKQTKSSGGNFEFELQRISVRNLRARFINDATNTFADFTIPGFVAKGNFGSSKYALELAGNIMLHELKSQGIIYGRERELNVWLAMDANSVTGNYSISKGTIETGKLKLSAIGSILFNDNQKQVALDIAATGSTLEEMLSLIPEKYKSDIAGYKFQGKGDIAAKITGEFGGAKTPALSVHLQVQNGDISERKSGLSLRSISAIADYSVQQDGKNEVLSIRDLKAKLGDGFVSGSLTMKGFSSPDILCNLNASLNLTELQQFLKYEHFTSLSGWVKLNASFDGHIEDLENPSSEDFLNSTFSGNGSIHQANIGLKKYDLPIKDLQSVFTFNGNDLLLQKFSFRAGKSDFALTGTLENLLSWIFVKNENLSITGTLASRRFDWDELSAAQHGSGGEYQFRLPAHININNLRISSTNFTFGKFAANNITGMGQMKEKVLSVTDIAMLTCQGKVSGQVNINAQGEKYSLLQAKVKLEKVNVKMLFTQFGNFGQDDLKDSNLEGLLTSDVIFAGTMLNDLSFDLNSIKTHADITIENGRLVNYSPMQSLSSFLKVEDLADIHFATMRNQIDIANQIIYIPAMEIKSSAIDLQLMGTHTFDNSIEYHFSIALADLIASKFRKRNKTVDNQAEFGPVEEDGRGRTRIYVSLTGTVENPIVKYDKKAMREKISNDMKTQKAELKQVLKAELKWVQGDTLKKAQQLKEKEIIKKQEQGKFVIEWDDDTKGM